MLWIPFHVTPAAPQPKQTTCPLTLTSLISEHCKYSQRDTPTPERKDAYILVSSYTFLLHSHQVGSSSPGIVVLRLGVPRMWTRAASTVIGQHGLVISSRTKTTTTIISVPLTHRVAVPTLMIHFSLRIIIPLFIQATITKALAALHRLKVRTL